MKRTLIALATLVFAGTLAAATEKPAVSQTTTAPPDSPLVAAARKTKKPAKKHIVITDDSVKNSTGHITTSTRILSDFNVPEPQKPADMVLAETKAKEKVRAAEREKIAKEAADAKQKQIARAAATAADEGGYEEDPAATEHRMDQQTSTAATSTSSQPQPSKHDETQRR